MPEENEAPVGVQIDVPTLEVTMSSPVNEEAPSEPEATATPPQPDPELTTREQMIQEASRIKVFLSDNPTYEANESDLETLKGIYETLKS